MNYDQAPYIPDGRFSRSTYRGPSVYESENEFTHLFPQSPPSHLCEPAVAVPMPAPYIYSETVIPSRASLVDNAISSQLSILRRYNRRGSAIPCRRDSETISSVASSDTRQDSGSLPNQTVSSASIRTAESSPRSSLLAMDWDYIEVCNFDSVVSDDEEAKASNGIDLWRPAQRQSASPMTWPGIVSTNPFFSQGISEEPQDESLFECFSPYNYRNDAQIIEDVLPSQSSVVSAGSAPEPRRHASVFDSLFSTTRRLAPRKRVSSGEQPADFDDDDAEVSDDPDGLVFRLQAEMVLSSCNYYDNDQVAVKPKRATLKSRLRSLVGRQ